MRDLGLKATATALVMLAATGAAVYVGGHVRRTAAPLHPAVLDRGAGASVGLSPGVRPTSEPPVTTTYVS